MRKTKFVWFGVALAALAALILLLCPVPASASVSSTTAEIEALKDKIKTIEQNLTSVDQKISSTKGELASAREYKTALDEKLRLVGEEIETAENLIAAYDSQIAEKTLEIANTQNNIGAQYEELLSFMRLSYEYSTLNYLQLILDSNNFEDFLSSVELFSNMIDYQEKTMDDLRDVLQQEKEAQQALEVYRQEQNVIYHNLDAQRATYEQLQHESANYLQQLQANLSSYQNDQNAMNDTLAKYKEEEEKLNKQLEEELALLAKQNAVFVGGEFIWPVNASLYKRISSGYGWRDLWGVQDFHLGIDIPCDYGADVWASNAGTVVRATSHYSYGNYVIIDHGGGISTLYAHNSKLLVSEGDVVTQGQVIALAGSTGNSSGNHCHFEVRVNGKTTQPLDYVVRPQ